MSYRRGSIVRVMLVVAILIFDAVLVRPFVLPGAAMLGMMAVGLAISLGLIGILVASGSLKRFCVGFVITAFVTAPFYYFYLMVARRSDDFFDVYVEWVLRSFSPWFITSETRFSLVFEAAYSLPFIAFASLGGLLTLVVHRQTTPKLAPGQTTP